MNRKNAPSNNQMQSSKSSSLGDVANVNSVYQVYKNIVKTKHLYVISEGLNLK